MSTILVPVDFSPTSLNALRYAVELAKARSANVEVLHAYPIPMGTPDMPVEMILTEEIMADARGRMDALVDDLKSEKVAVNTRLVAGSAAAEIVYLVEQSKPDLVVMGTHGVSAKRNRWLGSNALHVIDRAVVPVLTVPDGATYKPWQRVCCATDFDYHEIDVIREMASWVQLYHAELLLVHINAGNGDHAERNAPAYRESFIEKVRECAGVESVRYEYIFSNIELISQLREFASFNGSDVLVMLHHVQKGLTRLWHRSLTEDMVQQLDVPLLSYPVVKLEMES
jgi:nucleotide-binding universal stress UspA family protein